FTSTSQTGSNRPMPDADRDAAPPRRRRRRRGGFIGWAFAGPATLLVVGLSFFPAVWAFLISRTRWNGIAPPRDLGWGNYSNMLDDPQLWASVRHTAVLTALFVP